MISQRQRMNQKGKMKKKKQSNKYTQHIYQMDGCLKNCDDGFSDFHLRFMIVLPLLLRILP